MHSTIAGIVMECNPLHDGHRYILRQARQVSCADYVVVVMSGDFVQRGAPAIESKEKRVRDILSSGADLVIELPAIYATASAGYFARGSIALLSHLGCVTDLCFGSESGDISLLSTAADYLDRPESEAFHAALHHELAKGLSYPAARSAAVHATVKLPDTPNDLLAVEYLRNLSLFDTGKNICAHAIPRIKTASASEIRQKRIAADSSEINIDLFSDAILYALWREDQAGRFTDYLDVSPSLADKIHNNLMSFESASAFCQKLKSKDITYTRISRCLIHILLGITKELPSQYAEEGTVGYARVLGFQKESEALLGIVRDHTSIPLITSCAKACSDRSKLSPVYKNMLKSDISASMLYDLITQRSTDEPIHELSKAIQILRS